MSDERQNPKSEAVNPHTGQPVPNDAPRAASPAAGEPATGAAAAGTAPAGAAPGASSAAPTQQELAIRSALETVMDPEIGLSVIDLGLIREVIIQPGKTLIRMMLTTPFCPYAPQIIAEIKQATATVVPQECEVEVMPDAWSPDLMPDPGLLGFSY
jgi:metal-sulfur cluster biosynthetic enzyme